MERARLPRLELIRRPGAAAHPFPLAVSLQANQLLYASVFHAVTQGIATQQHLASPGGLEQVQAVFREQTGSDELWNEYFGYLEKYGALFGQIGFLDVVVQMASHWDWFIRRIAEFVLFARRIAEPTLSGKAERSLSRLGKVPLESQLSGLREHTGLSLEVKESDLSCLKEVFLVRNLGLHNRWEIDTGYLERTETDGWAIGDLRLVTVEELKEWQPCMVAIMRVCARSIAEHYVHVPEFEELSSAV